MLIGRPSVDICRDIEKDLQYYVFCGFYIIAFYDINKHPVQINGQKNRELLTSSLFKSNQNKISHAFVKANREINEHSKFASLPLNETLVDLMEKQIGFVRDRNIKTMMNSFMEKI